MYTKPGENIISDGENIYFVSTLEQDITKLEAQKTQKQTNIQNVIARMSQNLDDFTTDIDKKVLAKQTLIDAYNGL